MSGSFLSVPLASSTASGMPSPSVSVATANASVSLSAMATPVSRPKPEALRRIALAATVRRRLPAAADDTVKVITPGDGCAKVPNVRSPSAIPLVDAVLTKSAAVIVARSIATGTQFDLAPVVGFTSHWLNVSV